MRNRLPRIASAFCLGACLLAATSAAWAQGSNVAQTKHNLTSSGPGPIRVAGENRVCIFCHTPHAANPIAPLWNRQDPGSYYQTYTSTTLKAAVGQPTGSSRLCLSCHDGTIALTQTYNPGSRIPGGAVYITPQDRGYIGTNLRDDHPISFLYDGALASRVPGLNNPAALPRTLPLDSGNQLQCTTCHDPHDDSLGDFLRMDNHRSAMCISCHNLDGWTASCHATGAGSLSSATRDKWDNIPYTTVRDAACECCHRPHNAGGQQRLLRHLAEEDNCFPCHDGTVATRNIMGEFSKPSTHPVGRTTGVHDPVEDPVSAPEHVECVDCHNPHRTLAAAPTRAPLVKTSMQGVSGLTGTGIKLPVATNEFEVCYKCHSIRHPARTPEVDRVFPQDNIALKFALSNPGYHPVEGQGRNLGLPSLLPPARPTDLIYCTDCHGSNAGATGPLGPHGSQYRPILVRQYIVLDGTAESPTAYALCYGCHNRTSILNDQSFTRHHLHISDERTPCSVCHEPHGVEQQPHLINFDRNVVKPTKVAGGPTYTSTGVKHGRCTLLCHGQTHINFAY